MWMLDSTKLQVLSNVVINEWAFCIEILNSETIICGQSFGYLNVIQCDGEGEYLKTLIKTKFQAISHIYTIVKLAKSTEMRIEFAVGGQYGLYLATIQNLHIGISNEIILENICVKQMKEFEPDRFIVGVENNYPCYFIVDCRKGKPIV